MNYAVKIHVPPNKVTQLSISKLHNATLFICCHNFKYLMFVLVLLSHCKYNINI
nr:MAG TPA: hypothetical protein [Caudoviricetes sp.]